MKFSESYDSWRDVPDWASFLIEFGFAWLTQTQVTRRIAIVSMPSDSAAAGLITLGAMRKCLELDDANDMSRHYDRLVDLTRRQPRGVTLRHNKKAGVFVFAGFDYDRNPCVKKQRAKGISRFPITRLVAVDWRVDGEAPVAFRDGYRSPILNSMRIW